MVCFYLQTTEVWKGVYPFMGKDTSTISEKEVLFHIVLAIECNEESVSASSMWFLVPTAWVDINKAYYVFPPPTFRISNQLPDEQINIEKELLPTVYVGGKQCYKTRARWQKQ